MHATLAIDGVEEDGGIPPVGRFDRRAVKHNQPLQVPHCDLSQPSMGASRRAFENQHRKVAQAARDLFGGFRV